MGEKERLERASICLKIDNFLSKKESEFIIVGILLLFGIVIRAWHFGMVPTGVHQDEAMGAVDARALAEYGTDRFGTRYPVHFAAWGPMQMSVLLSYCMIPFIKILGFSITSIRLPMLLISCIGLLALYLCARKMGDAYLGFIILSLGIICPWHYMQSRWSMDCNMFPHMFLIAVVFLLEGVEKRWSLYISMIFFGFCSYCYGVANYSVPFFLLGTAIFLLRNKLKKIRDILFCALVYFIIVLPEFLTMFINIFRLEAIETPLFTIPRFPVGIRESNVLFMNFSWEQLWKNITHIVQSLWGRGDYILANNMPRFGPVYFITIPFFFLGFVLLIKKIKTADSAKEKFPFVVLLFWFIMGIWIGIVTLEVNVHRINIIYYLMLVIAGMGILWCIKKCRYLAIPICAVYAVLALMFARTYFGDWAKQSRTYYYYDVYVDALNYAKEIPCDYYYIFSDPQGDGVEETGEIITMFCHDIDAHYFQGISNIQWGKKVLPYTERYHFEPLTKEMVEENKGKSVVYLVRSEEKEFFSEEEYDIHDFYGAYYVISPLGNV